MKKSIRYTKKQARKFPLQKIADMQRDLDAYNFVFANLIGYLLGKFGEHRGKIIVPAIITSPSIAATEEVAKQISYILDAAIKAGGKVIELEAKVRELEEELNKYRSNE